MSRPVRATGEDLADHQRFIDAQEAAHLMGKKGKSWNATVGALYMKWQSFMRRLSSGGMQAIHDEWKRGGK